VAARVRVRNGIDPLDPSTPAQDVLLDGETAQLLSWSVARGIVARVVSPAGTFGSSRPVGRLALPARLEGFDCGSLFGNADATYWVNWFTNKLSAGSGVGILGLGSLPTLWNALSGVAPGLISSADKVASRSLVISLGCWSNSSALSTCSG
jgi:hypothetical protein